MKFSIASILKNNKVIAAAIFLILALLALTAARDWQTFADSWSNFTIIFLGIFIEAIPFLLLGTLASGLVELFISEDLIQRILPKSVILSTLLGCFLGLVFPVCECGVVPLVRRLYKKGLPISTGISFLLSAPVINPIVILSTLSAFGIGEMFWMRLGSTFLIAFITGMVFTTVESSDQVLNPSAGIICESCNAAHPAHRQQTAFMEKMRQLLQISTNELFEMGRYLIIGALLSSAMQTFIPQSALLEIGEGAVLSVLVMIALAIVLSICSTVDAFVALSFIGNFTTASVLSFLVYGPMVDIKSTLMFMHVFKRNAVTYLLLIPLVLVLVICISLNFFFI
jgi:hypothetical protein